MEVVFTKPFIRQLKKLEPSLQLIVCKRVDLLKLDPNNPSLRNT
jgi:mRNA-degrading endonuclease RelE of RelBE toxin-antitoxin system